MPFWEISMKNAMKVQAEAAVVSLGEVIVQTKKALEQLV